MTVWADVKPTSGSVANSYEQILDIADIPAAAGTPTWINVPDITALNPSHTPTNMDVTTYANKGSAANTKSGSTFSATVNVLKIRDANGEFQDEWLLLKNAADGKGEDNLILMRYYDALGASDAYEGKVSVSRAIANTGNNDPGFDTFTLTGYGEVLPIVNPNAAAAPVTP